MAQANHESARTVGWIAIVLVVIGAVNWGLVGLFSFNLVEAIFGHLTTLSRLIYILVALAGLYLIYFAVQLSNDLKFVQHRES
ncbi:MAG: DUF378 domain-containing protein [Polyangiaceae bacterium]